mmetsp:Transcript_22779/g.38928  ORF Transcript_22779/g.38928 Transcript_22779/m.38928 type:complete len:159 (-) Transcript_22779:628-1104(-)
MSPPEVRIRPLSSSSCRTVIGFAHWLHRHTGVTGPSKLRPLWPVWRVGMQQRAPDHSGWTSSTLDPSRDRRHAPAQASSHLRFRGEVARLRAGEAAARFDLAGVAALAVLDGEGGGAFRVCSTLPPLATTGDTREAPIWKASAAVKQIAFMRPTASQP